MSLNIEKDTIIKNPQNRDFLADAYYYDSSDALPLLVFAHGYKGYKDWGAFGLMAEKFAKAGFYFVKFNFSHNGTTISQPREFADLEAFGHNNFTKELLDYEAVISYFSAQKPVNSDKIAILGHSRGGGISIIEGYENPTVRAVAVLAGVSHFGYRFPSGDRLKDWEESGIMYSENNRTKQQMPHYYQFFEDYKANENRFNIQYATQHLEKPLLIVQGTDDEAVKEKEATLLAEWGKQSTLEIIDGANHTFGAAEPWNNPELPKHLDLATSKIIGFLKKNL